MSTPNRQPAGVPTGGQFAPDARARANVTVGGAVWPSTPGLVGGLVAAQANYRDERDRLQRIVADRVVEVMRDQHPGATKLIFGTDSGDYGLGLIPKAVEVASHDDTRHIVEIGASNKLHNAALYLDAHVDRCTDWDDELDASTLDLTKQYGYSRDGDYVSDQSLTEALGASRRDFTNARDRMDRLAAQATAEVARRMNPTAVAIVFSNDSDDHGPFLSPNCFVDAEGNETAIDFTHPIHTYANNFDAETDRVTVFDDDLQASVLRLDREYLTDADRAAL